MTKLRKPVIGIRYYEHDVEDVALCLTIEDVCDFVIPTAVELHNEYVTDARSEGWPYSSLLLSHKTASDMTLRQSMRLFHFDYQNIGLDYIMVRLYRVDMPGWAEWEEPS